MRGDHWSEPGYIFNLPESPGSPEEVNIVKKRKRGESIFAGLSGRGSCTPRGQTATDVAAAFAMVVDDVSTPATFVYLHGHAHAHLHALFYVAFALQHARGHCARTHI